MGVINLTIKKGATWKQNLTYTDASGVIIDLSGYTARMQIRQTYQSAEVLAELTTENGGITITGGTGELDLLISATDTANLPPIVGLYDLEIILGSEVTRLIEGKVNITENITR